ncbi:MAG: 50S ribosomal protein L25/general stress protein Ctc [Evtepia sp.]|uniref:50S ribosomal protein L25/general stress protein Ctc n=1 Tax=Evtepia sp. TaxID=2773933 RepID=UPI002A757B97|nr:50S ribosomal protein L25/general stress protein Ctc [Evtepia sp.]MDY3014711.1 50S ribosomal protein L25/general stress protein Ctc [Evtepia sp.]
MDVIKVVRRDAQEKANKLRKRGIVPCCVYGGDLKESISIQMEEQDASRLFRTKREGSKVGLDIDGHVILTQIKEKKRYLSGEAEHVSFQALSEDKKVNSIAHIFLKNTDLVPGNLSQLLFEVPFSSLPEDMVDTVTIDIAGLPAGTILTVKDIPEFQNEKIDLQIKGDSVVVRISERRRAGLHEEQAQE